VNYLFLPWTLESLTWILSKSQPVLDNAAVLAWLQNNLVCGSLCRSCEVEVYLCLGRLSCFDMEAIAWDVVIFWLY
jgi:hypothetical protein